MQYFPAVERAFGRAGFSCAREFEAGEIWDYVVRAGLSHGIHRNKIDCSGCMNYFSVCSRGEERIALEMVFMEWTHDNDAYSTRDKFEGSGGIDAALSTGAAADPDGKWWHRGAAAAVKRGVYWENSITTQELLFNELFEHYPPHPAAQGPPDAVFIVQNVHDCTRHNRRSFRRSIRWFFDLVDEATARWGGRVYWWSPTAVHAGRLDPRFVNVTNTACMEMITEEASAALAPFIVKPETQWRGTFSLLDASRVRPDLSTDGLHYHQDWYDMVATSWVDLLALGETHHWQA